MKMRWLVLLLSMGVVFGGPGAAQSSLSAQSDRSERSEARPDGFATLSRQLMPAVVNITTQQTVAPQGLPSFPEGSPLEQFNEFFGRDPEGFRREGSLGSGFVISPEGFIVTNNHVISGADEINAVFSDGRTLRAELVGADEATDIAVLRVRQKAPFAFVDWADSDTAEVGDWVIAIGNPFGFGGSVSVGIVSARNRDIQSGNYDNYIQTDAAINRGNSGGPLFNLDGQVLGVNTAIISPTGGSVGLGFSIPANLARRIAAQLMAFGVARRGWFGVNVQDVDADIASAYGAPGEAGVLITRIDPAGPAAGSDFQVGDFVQKFDGVPVDSVRALSRIVADTPIGKQVEVSLIREGRVRQVPVTLGELPGAAAPETPAPILPDSLLSQNALGVELARLSDEGRRRHGVSGDVSGVLVASVSPTGPSFGKLRRGDVIIEIGFEKVSEPSEVLSQLDALSGAGEDLVLVRLVREGQTMFFPVTLAARQVP